ncbi:hypothetical protein QWY86_07105 [Pedobacter aquatilis]|uniref:hypothetical protein n=1 Tax=Pedobacter aquatilis TaxID=351343 RepID=UPI0025B59245|nr:hypothetical protein [Pedobacter aquatilis]MDN3586424.1 hypothetical protein [Pedobacter aquatilis]
MKFLYLSLVNLSMKFFMMLLLFSTISCGLFAQKHWKYKIKIVENSGKKHRGFFYAAQDNGLVLVRKNGDTSLLKAENINQFYIHRRGVVAPFAIAGAAIFLIFAIDNPDALETAVLIFVGAPIGVCLGLVTGELFANKRFYKKLEAKDFPLIKRDLQKYTELKLMH